MKQITHVFAINIVNVVIASKAKQSLQIPPRPPLLKGGWGDCFVAVTPRNDILRGLRNSNYGFTLIEAVILILILGILAFVAYPIFGDVAGIRLNAAARRLQSDIRYAQELAMTNNNRTRVTFDTASDTYNIYYCNLGSSCTWPADWTLATDPYTGGNYTVQLNSGDFTGVLIDSTSFASDQVEFSTNGAPNSGGTVTLSASSNTKDVTVTANTGRVS